LPEKYHNLKALKKRGCAVNLNYDTASDNTDEHNILIFCVFRLDPYR